MEDRALSGESTPSPTDFPDGVTDRPRLEVVGSAVAVGARVIDVGTDHGRLLEWLLLHRNPTVCIGSDARSQPLSGARTRLAHAGLSERCDLRLGDGLSIVRADEVDTVCCTGLGGRSIAEILRAGFQGGTPITCGAPHLRLVLQPFGNSAAVRTAVDELGFAILAEAVGHGRGHRLHTTIVAEPGTPAPCPFPDPVARRIGPRLARRRDARQLVARSLERDREAARHALRRAGERASSALRAEVAELDEVLEWVASRPRGTESL